MKGAGETRLRQSCVFPAVITRFFALACHSRKLPTSELDTLPTLAFEALQRETLGPTSAGSVQFVRGDGDGASAFTGI